MDNNTSTKKNKVQVKSVKKFRGHDGQGWECKVFLNGKKVAGLTDDGWGGEIEVWEQDKDKYLELHTLIENAKILSFQIDDEQYFTSLDGYVEDLVNEVLWKKSARGDLAISYDIEMDHGVNSIECTTYKTKYDKNNADLQFQKVIEHRKSKDQNVKNVKLLNRDAGIAYI